MSQTKVFVVTGANKGIGLELVRGLALFYKDSIVVGTVRHQDLAEKALAELKQSNGITNVKYEILDLKDSHSIEHFAKSIISKYDHIDGLVNSAAISPSQTSAEAAIDTTLQTNVYGLIDLTEKLLPLLKKSKDARIVNLGSRAGNLEPFSKQIQDQYLAVKTTRDVYELAYAFEAAAHHNDLLRIGYKTPDVINVIYAASKSLVHAYSAALANEHPEITSTSYCPGPIDTDMARSVFDLIPDLRNLIPKSYPPKDGADTGLFLIQSERHHLVNGGYYAERKPQSRINAPFRG